MQPSTGGRCRSTTAAKRQRSSISFVGWILQSSCLRQFVQVWPCVWSPGPGPESSMRIHFLTRDGPHSARPALTAFLPQEVYFLQDADPAMPCEVPRLRGPVQSVPPNPARSRTSVHVRTRAIFAPTSKDQSRDIQTGQSRSAIEKARFLPPHPPSSTKASPARHGGTKSRSYEFGAASQPYEPGARPKWGTGGWSGRTTWWSSCCAAGDAFLPLLRPHAPATLPFAGATCLSVVTYSVL